MAWGADILRASPFFRLKKNPVNDEHLLADACVLNYSEITEIKEI